MDLKAVKIAINNGHVHYTTQKERAQLLTEFDLRLDAWPEIDGAPAPLDQKIWLWLNASKHIKVLNKQIDRFSHMHIDYDTTDLHELRSFIAQCQRIITLVNNDTIENSKIIYK